MTGTFKGGDCEDGKLTGKIGKHTLSGTFTENYTAVAGSIPGTFSCTLAADNRLFMGSRYNSSGPEASFPPGRWGRKIG